MFQMSPNQWIIPTKSKAVGRGRKRDMTGTIIAEVPKPAIVPSQEAMRVRITMYNAITNLVYSLK
jgi:hypothetical protein